MPVAVAVAVTTTPVVETALVAIDPCGVSTIFFTSFAVDFIFSVWVVMVSLICSIAVSVIFWIVWTLDSMADSIIVPPFSEGGT